MLGSSQKQILIKQQERGCHLTLMGGLIKMRKVTQLGFLVVSKNKPKPKRCIQKINHKNFLDRLNNHGFIRKVNTTDTENLLVDLDNITGGRQVVEPYMVGSVLRLSFKKTYSTTSHQWNIKKIGFGSYKRAKRSWLFLFDYQHNQTYVFINRKQSFDCELEIWESSDINYWG